MGNALSGAGYFLSAGATYSDSRAKAAAQQMQGDYANEMAQANAELAESQGEDALTRGDRSASQYRGKVKQVKGAQRAGQAAQGLDINSGSAAELAADVESIGAQDILTIKSNAWREAWGFKQQSADYRKQGRFAALAGKYGSKSTLLTGNLAATGQLLQGFGSLARGSGGGGGKE